MHGRIKVKTTAEQEAEKAKEREKKMKIYQTVLEHVLCKRKNKELDDELLELTSKILSPNPDFYSLWNLRKEIFLIKKQESPTDEFQKLCSDELRFLQTCLHTNPKSYSIWFHRRFVMTTMPSADWNNELKLCTLFLSYDERNFHCWDYRRFVVSNTNVSTEEELRFTSKKIFDNFSNYSAWHNRSMLLPQVYPDKETRQGIEKSVLSKEFELAQNAFFTDPYDQSAWFYHRWLLGREKKKCDILYFSATYSGSILNLTASFTDQVKLSENVHVVINDVCCSGSWKPASLIPGHCFVWLFTGAVKERNMDEALSIELNVFDHGIKKVLLLKSGEVRALFDWSAVSSAVSFTRNELPSADVTTLQGELESCNLLLEEEQGNKWTLLTVVFLMRALNSWKYQPEIREYLSQLCTVDPSRKGYYADLRSKFEIENRLEEIRRDQGHLEVVNLENQELTSLYYHQFLTNCKLLRLSHNNLKHLGPVYLLRNLEKLDLDDNKITEFLAIGQMTSLMELSLRNNGIESFEGLSDLASLASLKTLTLEGNPICTEADYRSLVKAAIPQLAVLDGRDL